MIRRDYVERLIAQAAQALAQVLDLVKAGQFDPALLLIRNTSDQVLGPLARLVERLDAASAVELAGRYERDRIRLYAALVAEEGSIHELRGRESDAQRCYRRSLDLYAATALAGTHLLPADLERIAALLSKTHELDGRSAEQQRRLLDSGH